MTMATYIVKQAQNIWDIAISLYGSVEGVFDLLISNPEIGMKTDLPPGMGLEYHPDFVINRGVVDWIGTNVGTPANKERNVYFNNSESPLKAIGLVPESEEYVCFSMCGQGVMIVDWGDNSGLQPVTLTNTVSVIEHYFDNTVSSRRLKFYGDFEIEVLDFTKFAGTLYPVAPITVDEFVSHANRGLLTGLLLFKGTNKVDLRYSNISSLDPVADMSLQSLDLRDARFASVDVLDDYLEYLVTNHGTRRGCTVYLSSQPTERGMTAINTLISSEEWNSQHPWSFIINDTTYTYQNGTPSN